MLLQYDKFTLWELISAFCRSWCFRIKFVLLFYFLCYWHCFVYLDVIYLIWSYFYLDVIYLIWLYFYLDVIYLIWSYIDLSSPPWTGIYCTCFGIWWDDDIPGMAVNYLHLSWCDFFPFVAVMWSNLSVTFGRWWFFSLGTLDYNPNCIEWSLDGAPCLGFCLDKKSKMAATVINN